MFVFVLVDCSVRLLKYKGGFSCILIRLLRALLLLVSSPIPLLLRYVQFTTYDGFCCAVRSLCGRVLTREGSRLVVPCSIFFDTSGYFSKEMEKKRRTGEIYGRKKKE